jgi:phosphopantothenoylcysteine decarboxylase/phosphopantothenate--cysteine ligase
VEKRSNHDKANDLAVELKSDALSNVRIAVCMGGGIAAIEVPKVVRELRRLGADVRVFATESALKFVGKDALEWASTKPVVVQSGGLAEHVAQEDTLLVFPATTDLIGKAANGICPDACSTYIQSALGREMTTAFLPTMHDSLRNSPAFKDNMRRLSQFRGVSFIEPRIEEGKWKSPSPETIALEVAFRHNQAQWLQNGGSRPKALVTLGGTATKIDLARTITNLSTGTLGAILVRKLLEQGIQVTALCGHHTATLSACSELRAIDCREFSSMEKHINELGQSESFSAFFHIAAVSDYGTEKTVDKKISSTANELELKLTRLPKLIASPSLAKIPFRSACKFTSTDGPEDLKKAQKLLKENKLDAVIWNWGEAAFGSTDNKQKSIMLRKDGSQQQLQDKDHIASSLVEELISNLRKANLQNEGN